MEVELDNKLGDNDLSAGLCTMVDEAIRSVTDDVNVTGVIKVVGNARLTLAPCWEVTGTGDGIEGAVEEFMAESSQALIQP